MIDIDGTEMSQQENEFMAHLRVDGVFLFSRNDESVEQIQSLVSKIRRLAVRTNIDVVSVDHEGARVRWVLCYWLEFTEVSGRGDLCKSDVMDKNEGWKACQSIWKMSSK